MSLGMAYSINKRSKKMAKGGMAHCAHGGPAYCNAGCYAEGGEVEKEGKEESLSDKMKKAIGVPAGHDQLEQLAKEKYAKGGMVKNAPEAAKNAIHYEEGIDEQEDEMANMPRLEKPISMDSEDAEEEGDMVSEDTPMKMARGGMMNGKKMARMMMAKGGIVSAEAMRAGLARTEAIEDHSGGSVDNEDIDIYQTTPHDDNLSDEGEYPLMEEEGYEEGHQAKNRRKGGLLERVMAKIHSR